MNKFLIYERAIWLQWKEWIVGRLESKHLGRKGDGAWCRRMAMDGREGGEFWDDGGWTTYPTALLP